MFPIRDHNPSEKTPYVTYALILANVGIFLATWPLFSDERALWSFYADWALVPVFLADGHSYHGLVTSMFLHGGVMHLAGNMLFLWIFGDNLEEDLGHVGYLAFYLIGGVAAGLFQVMSEPLSNVPTVGASGAIAAVMGGYLLLYPKARVDILFFFVVFIRVVPIPAWVMLGLWFLFQLANSLASDAGSGGVAYWAHSGGFIAGFVLMLPFWLFRGGKGFWRRTDGHPDHPEARYRFQQSSIPTVRRRR